MLARISNDKIIVQEAMSYWDLRYVLDDLNQILLSKGFKPKYFFGGTPVMGQGGFSVIIKLDKKLLEYDKKLLSRILRGHGVEVVFEE